MPGELTPIDMGTLGGFWSFAYDINDAGDVVGRSSIGGSNEHAFVVVAGSGVMEDLGSLGGNSGAYAINANGLITGYSYTQTGMHAFLTRAGSKQMTDLGSLGGFPDFSAGYAINTKGDVVGYSNTPDGNHAIVVPAGSRKMLDLNHLATLPANVILVGAIAINDRGQILSLGVDSTGTVRGYILRPIGKRR